MCWGTPSVLRPFTTLPKPLLPICPGPQGSRRWDIGVLSALAWVCPQFCSCLWVLEKDKFSVDIVTRSHKTIFRLPWIYQQKLASVTSVGKHLICEMPSYLKVSQSGMDSLHKYISNVNCQLSHRVALLYWWLNPLKWLKIYQSLNSASPNNPSKDEKSALLRDSVHDNVTFPS